ncbi:unnamed protein product [Porites evermanni]|uniref:Uncharacterized protein n=1 Tax=Porites evermanni TaxID=104178 RepID=A0ABN8LM41_9CNID|nr:unnamed protein product [Porites evermanni]
MGFVEHVPVFKNSNTSNKKIPEYAKDFKKEWLYITGINKKCGEVETIISDYIDEDEEVQEFLEDLIIFTHKVNIKDKRDFEDNSYLEYLDYSDSDSDSDIDVSIEDEVFRVAIEIIDNDSDSDDE